MKHSVTHPTKILGGKAEGDGANNLIKGKEMKYKLGLAIFLYLLIFRVETHAQQALPQQGAAELRVQLGKSLLITSQDPLQRVSVTDPAIASAVIVSPTQVLIHGMKAGSETLVLWDSNEQARSFNLVVDLDINSLRETVRQMFPSEALQVMQSGG